MNKYTKQAEFEFKLRIYLKYLDFGKYFYQYVNELINEIHNNLIDENQIYIHFNNFINLINKISNFINNYLENNENNDEINLFEKYLEYNDEINLFENYKCIIWYIEKFINIDIEKLVIPENLKNIGYEYPELRYIDYLYRDIKYYKLQKSIIVSPNPV